MATVMISTSIEGHINKYDAFKALCEDIGLPMLIDGTTNEYSVENKILYHTYDGEIDIYDKNPRTVMLFENLLAIKCLL